MIFMRSRMLSLPLGFLSALLSLMVVAQACSSESDSTDGGSGTSDAGSSASGGKGTAGKGGSGSGNNNGGGNGQGNNSSGGNGSGNSDGGITLDGPTTDPDAFFANDPPPTTCDGGPTSTPVIGGTPECPDDKNREGCPCFDPGKTAPCWPGFRKNRNRGICKDGVTTCVGIGETSGKWGKCEGYVLPKENATTSKDRCLCFSAGQWKLNNLSPCFVSDGDGKVIGAVSTIETAPGQAKCPTIDGPDLKAPAEPFATTTLKVDCAGHFKLCYTLRAGKADTASEADCIVAQICTEADYNSVDQAQPFPALPSWVTSTPAQVACAQQFATTGGYGEMSVVGVSVECDQVPQQVFNRVNYCPIECNKNPTAPGCEKCMNGGSGSF